MAYLAEDKFNLKYFDSTRTGEIKSDGIRVAGEMGVPNEIIDLAYFVRSHLNG